MIKSLMIDVDGVLVRGRPIDGRHWTSELEVDLGLSISELEREFFAPYWGAIVLGRAGLSECLAPVLTRIAPHLRCDDVISYWFEQDSHLDTALLTDLSHYR